MRKGELYPLSFLFGPEEKKIRNGKKREEGKKERRARAGLIPFSNLHSCLLYGKAVKAREGEKRRRWLNRAAASACVCVLKNGDYDLGSEYW